MDEKWCGDVTYVQVGSSWLYLVCVIGICSRQVLGYSMASHTRTELVIHALTMAVAAHEGRSSWRPAQSESRRQQSWSAHHSHDGEGPGQRPGPVRCPW
ncbi:DDE-type integrase/transposase/recombinase [Streptomyces misionensis]|uniref:DDE-type integrase/transposase/recombinase n=1 Tax=Streptomyces misionensis TaxID=67331 RepID=UPI00368EFBF2